MFYFRRSSKHFIGTVVKYFTTSNLSTHFIHIGLVMQATKGETVFMRKGNFQYVILS